MNKGRIALIVCIAVVVFLAGTLVQPGIELVEQYRGNQALLRRMATEPAYQVIDAVESYNPRVTVLNVIRSEEKRGGFVTAWVLHDTMGISEEEWQPYLLDTLAHLFQTLRDNYPGRRYYAIVVAVVEMVPTVEGPKAQARGGFLYILDANGISRFLNAPTSDTIDNLITQGQFIFEVVYYNNVVLDEILPREPGYIWPWNGDCEPCGS